METAILTCLLILIYLLLQDKLGAKKKSNKMFTQSKQSTTSSNIIGKTKPVERQSLPINSNDSPNEKLAINPTTLDIEFDENENVDRQILQEEPDKAFSNQPDFEEEEEEWKKYIPMRENNGLAYGVNFEELSTVEYFLRNDHHHEPLEKKTATTIVQKLYGTELFNLLENSFDGASQKMAELLDNILSTEATTGSSILQQSELEDFDISNHI